MATYERRVRKGGLSATVDLAHLNKLDDITIARRSKFSPIVNEILGLGLEYYELKETQRMCREQEEEIARARASVGK